MKFHFKSVYVLNRNKAKQNMHHTDYQFIFLGKPHAGQYNLAMCLVDTVYHSISILYCNIEHSNAPP